jgi:hypothetical protein
MTYELYVMTCTIPNDICTVPNDICTVPNDICNIPNDICTVPNDICTVPNDIRNIPNDICTVPNDICNIPNDMYIYNNSMLLNSSESEKFFRKKFAEKINIYVTCPITCFPQISCRLWEIVNKFDTARQITDDNTTRRRKDEMCIRNN